MPSYISFIIAPYTDGLISYSLGLVVVYYTIEAMRFKTADVQFHVEKG